MKALNHFTSSDAKQCSSSYLLVFVATDDYLGFMAPVLKTDVPQAPSGSFKACPWSCLATRRFVSALLLLSFALNNYQ
jgi:hypothetical protein